MKKNLILNCFVILIFLCFSYCYLKYFQVKTVIEKTSPINYEILNKKEVNGGRGSYYIMNIIYCRKIKSIHITSNEFENSNFKPKVYYNSSNKSFLTAFSLLIYKRFSVFLFTIICILLLLKNKKIKSYFSKLSRLYPPK